MKNILKIILLFVFCSTGFAQITGLSGWDIILDPGHSQKENMGIYNYSEAEKNLRVALYVRDYLLNNTDIDTVYMTRVNDQQIVSLSQRSSLANQLGTSWYHSFHSDAGSPNYTSTILLWGMYRNGSEKIPNGGKAMSDIMVKLLTNGMRCDTRGSIGDCKFYGCDFDGPYLHVNRETTMPSELSEAGFHTNPVQNQLFMNAEHKKLQAYTLYWSILKYFNIALPKVGICAGFVSDVESGEALNGATVEINGKTYTTDTYESLFNKYSTDPEALRNGFYFIEELPNDSVTINVNAEGYDNYSKRVFVIDSFFTFTDLKLVSNVPPTITSINITEQDSIYPGNQTIIVNFSRPMNSTSVQENLKIVPEAALSFIWTNGDKTLTIKTDSLDFETNYTLTFSGASIDKYNHQYDGNKDGIGGDESLITFKTKVVDAIAPEMISVYPSSNSTDVELQPIVSVLFNEALSTTSIGGKFKIIRNLDQSSVSGVMKFYLFDDNKSLVHLFPGSELKPNESYTLQITPGIKDIHGNSTSSAQDIVFTTSASKFVVTSIDNFESNFTGNWWQPQQSGSTKGILTYETSYASSSTIYNYVTKSLHSMMFNYGWDKTAGDWLIREYLSSGTPKSVVFNKNYIMQTYLYGDGKGNKIRFCVNDNIGGTTGLEVSPWFNVDWYGWKLISWDMTNDGTGSWIGDGTLNGNMKFDSYQFSFNPGSENIGLYYIDDLRIVTKTTVGIEEERSSELPKDYSLEQNYPNPFNPTTKIKYSIPVETRHASSLQNVQLKIYDILGNEVVTLVNEQKAAGNYEVDFNANGYSSGVYYYQLRAGEFVQSKKMVLIK